MASSLLNVMNCAKAERCNEMSLKCAETYKESDRPWGDLTKCYSLKGNTLMNSLGEPEKKYTKADFDNCTHYFSGKNPCLKKEGFELNDYLTHNEITDTVTNYSNLNTLISEINDTNGTERKNVQTVLDRYVEMKSKREILESQLNEMNSETNDVNLQTNSLVYTTLFTTALGTCLLYFFIKMQ